jgi:hypothetical protein
MRRVVPLLLVASLIASCSDDNGTSLRPVTTYTATLTAANEVPPVTTPASTATATGTFKGVLDGKIFTYTLVTTGISANTSTTGMAHIHGPAAAGVNAGILVNFAAAGAPFGSASSLTTGLALNATGRLDLNTDIMNSAGTATVITAQAFIDALNAGQLYVNVHTTANPGGEIRGQIVKQ